MDTVKRYAVNQVIRASAEVDRVLSPAAPFASIIIVSAKKMIGVWMLSDNGGRARVIFVSEVEALGLSAVGMKALDPRGAVPVK